MIISLASRNKIGQFVKGHSFRSGTHLSKETRERISENRKGKCLGKNHPNYNPNRHSEETILCACGCGTRIPKYDYRGRKRKYAIGHTMVGRKREISKEWARKIGDSIIRGGKLKGKNHWNWKGGVTGPLRSIRHSREYKEWRLAVYKRDHFRCHHCGKHCSSKNIIAHHLLSFKNYPELRFDIDNGITLCRKCHWDLHKDRWSLI